MHLAFVIEYKAYELEILPINPGQIMPTNMLLLIFAFLHPFIDNFNCRDQKHRNTLFHIKTNLCNGSQIIMHKLLVHEFSI